MVILNLKEMKKIIELNKKDFFSENELRKKSEVLNFDDPTFNEIINELTEAFMNNPISVGLAMPQIGIFKRVAIVNIDKNNNPNHLYLINPEIVSLSGSKKTMKETCLSLPNYRGAVTRREKIVLKYYDLKGELNEAKFESFTSRVVQHEIDHLDGILYVDRMENKNDLEEINGS